MAGREGILPATAGQAQGNGADKGVCSVVIWAGAGISLELVRTNP